MNLGFYTLSNGGSPQNTKIFNFLNDATSKGDVKDASVFFRNTDFNPIACKFGMFDDADVWHFKGNLICTSIETLKSAINVVNDIKLGYLFSVDDTSERNIFDLVALSQDRIKVFVNNEVDYNSFYRLTGKKPVLVENWTVEKIKEVFDE